MGRKTHRVSSSLQPSSANCCKHWCQQLPARLLLSHSPATGVGNAITDSLERHTAKQLPCLAICCPFAGLCHLDLSSLTLIQLSATLKSFLKYLSCAPPCSKPLEQVQGSWEMNCCPRSQGCHVQMEPLREEPSALGRVSLKH